MRILCYIFIFTASSGIISCNYFSSKKNETIPEKVTLIATHEIDKAINANPNDASLYFKRGLLLRKENEDSLALLDFKKAILLDSTKSNYHSALGDLLFDHKDISGSLTYIQKAISLNPNDEVAHLKMAQLFLFTEEYPKAFVEINTVLRGNVYNAEAYFLKGMCYKYMKDTAKAISSFQTAVQTEPKYVDAHLQLAILFEGKKDALALKYYENAYASDSTNLEPLYGKAMYWQNLGNYSEAKKVLNRMIILDQNYPQSYYNMGWMLMQEDSTEKAIRQFNIAIQVKPDYAEAYYNRGICYEIENNLEKANADYNQALDFKSNLEGVQSALDRTTKKNKN